MLRYAFRRVLWVFPSVLAASLICFFVLSLIPLEADLPSRRDAASVAARRHQFLDLPLFFNVQPKDVRTRAGTAIDTIVASEPDSTEAADGQRELLRIGGAAMPVVLARFDGLKPEQRQRLALAMAPLAERMGIEHRGEPSDPERAVMFWTHLWKVRGVEFREATARSAVRRFVRYGTAAREEHVRVLDTFALPLLFEALEAPTTAAEVVQTRRLIDAIAHVTERDDRVAPGANVADAVACIERWQRWWMVYETDFSRLTGAGRVAAFTVQTRYGKWVFEAVVMRMGKDAEGRPMLDQLLAHARVTLSIVTLGMALAYLLAIPLGTLAAYFRGRTVDRIVAAAVLLPYALSPAVLGMVAVGLAAPLTEAELWAAALLGLTLVADPTRQQRAALLPVLAEDYVRAAVARGVGPLRLLFVHGLRNALLPVATRAATELPVALTACFVLERVFGLAGLGEMTMAAVAQRDVRWLMALAVAGAVLAVVALVLTDVFYAVLDPRLRRALALAKRRRV